MLWTIYVGVVGLLIFGAVIRTSAKTGGEHPLANAKTEDSGLKQNGRGSEGSERNALADQERQAVRLAESEDHDWVEVSGSVLAYDVDSLEIQLRQGSQLELSGRAWRFIQEEGFMLSPGDELVLQGFYENGEYEVGRIESLTSGSVLMIRDEFGTPLWSGRGR